MRTIAGGIPRSRTPVALRISAMNCYLVVPLLQDGEEVVSSFGAEVRL
jgi:hypothetical protein